RGRTWHRRPRGIAARGRGLELVFLEQRLCAAASGQAKPMNPKVLQLHASDNVLVALQNLAQGDAVTFAGTSYSLGSSVAAKHKFAIQDLAAGDPILMYGVVVGKAVEPIAKGNLLTTRNVRHDASAFHEKSENFRWIPPDVSRWAGKKF